MADNARALAMNYASANFKYSAFAPTYQDIVNFTEKMIRAERDQMLAVLVQLAEDYADDVKGEVYYRDAMKALLARWGHTSDE